MALNKKIILDNGIEINYHRIVSLTKITNLSNNIEVSSYISEEKRNEERIALEEAIKTGQYPESNIFISSSYFQIPYNENMNIEEAYNYLKTTEMFKDSIDA